MNDGFLFYRGHEGFEKVLVDEELSVPGRIIRVYNYGAFSGDEKLYVIGIEKQLFEVGTEERVKAKDVLSEKVALDGWSVEGRAIELLPVEEMRKYLDSLNS